MRGGPNFLFVSAFALGEPADVVVSNRGKPVTGYRLEI